MPDNRRPFSLWKAPARKGSSKGTAPRKLLDGLGYVFRMTAFRDRKRLLVWHEKGIHIFDVTKRIMRPLPLNNLKDPDYKDYRPLRVMYPAPGPGDSSITFVGELWDGDPDHEASHLIYTCRLDGTHIRRITDCPSIDTEQAVALCQFHSPTRVHPSGSKSK